MATVNVTLNDPQHRLDAVPLLVPTIRAAVDYLDRYLVFRGTVDVAVNVESTSTGRFAGNGDISFVGRRGGFDTWESSLAAEARTGTDPDPAKADLSIFIDPASSYLAHLWWDPAIGSSLAANPPNDRTDAFTVVVHELLHGMGIVGWRDWQTGALPGDYQSMWDAQVTLAGGRATFNGPATLALLGQPLEVRLGGSQGAFHLGNGPDIAASAQPWVERSNFNSYYYFDGERYTLGRLELALLQDLGWQLDAGVTLTDVVNRWDDRDSDLYIVGWDTAEQLTGGPLADRIEGRGGNDVLDGGGGDDTLLGGAGTDAVRYALDRSFYSVTAGSGALQVQALGGTEGRDQLSAVERLHFADRSVAYDLGGAAGTTARLLGAVFGPAAVHDRGAAGIGLQKLDQGMSALDLARLAIDLRLGASASAADIVTLLYTHVVGVAPDAPALATYTGLLADGTYDRGSLTLMAAMTDLQAQRIDLVGLAASGLDYTPT